MINYYSMFLNNIVEYATKILNTVSISIVIYAVIVGNIKHRKGLASAKHVICKGISDALNYNLASEVMKIIISDDIKDLALIGGILVLKAMITALFILELKQDEMQDESHERVMSKRSKKQISK